MTRLALKEDHTTTGGRVLGGSADQYAEDGRPFALDGDKATCGNCKGLWPILGSAHDWMDQGRSMVKDLDPVHCPCGQNRVFASGNSPFDYETGGSSEPIQQSAPKQTYDEQVKVRASRGSLEGYPYLIEQADGQTICGRVDSSGLLPRIYGETADHYAVFWGDEALAHEEWQ
jgi:uncharacterized Zn-binding protein involved in type VI secretion